MTGTEFRTLHGDPTTWTTTDIESYDVIRRNDAHLAAADRERDFARCSQRWASATNFRRYKAAKPSTSRLRKLLAHAA
ncbi:hypothetical protein [Streptomyces sp. BE133]|uniref:hypothetical protein n=1 Tax=Streptomyces sp. BE133 TaxID=3002523 RepID=UPI002E771B30|nr:hypothetical protein [Streptomyces sp. BE133]MEE1812604.1 hypothetical protein [Streptomyces sp. BE133]